MTLWYRSPEILLGSKHYGSKADMWATGCILAELILNSPLFPAKTEIELLTLLIQTLGTHLEKKWVSFAYRGERGALCKDLTGANEFGYGHPVEYIALNTVDRSKPSV